MRRDRRTAPGGRGDGAGAGAGDHGRDEPSPGGAWWITGIAYDVDPSRGAVPLVRYAKWLRVAAIDDALDWIEHVYWDARRLGPEREATAPEPPLDLGASTRAEVRFRTTPGTQGHARLGFRAGTTQVLTHYSPQALAVALPPRPHHAVYQVSRAAGRDRIVDNTMSTALPVLREAAGPGFAQFRGHGYRVRSPADLPPEVRALALQAPDRGPHALDTRA